MSETIISILVPVFNEEATVGQFLEKVIPVMEKTGFDYEVVFINDGSRDKTAEAVENSILNNKHVRLVQLSRNFGKEAALTAGLSYSRGSAVIPMDCDLQDPPEVVPVLIEKWLSGYQVVLAKRRSRGSDSFLKRTTAKWFYEVMASITDINIPHDCGDFRLMDRQVVDAVLTFKERNRFMKGIMAAVGFKTTCVEYDRPERVAGTTKFNFWKLWNFALDGIAGFSSAPLKVWTYIGFMVASVSFFYGVWIIFKTFYFGVVTPGFATMMVAILFLGGIQLVGIGVLGEYMGRILTEAKQRPLFLVERLEDFSTISSAQNKVD